MMMMMMIVVLVANDTAAERLPGQTSVLQSSSWCCHSGTFTTDTTTAITM